MEEKGVKFMAEEIEIGKIKHYFSKISVGIIELAGDLKVGETIHIKGHSSDFSQKVDSMQIEHQEVKEAKAGDSVGIKVTDKVKEGDKVFKVVK